MSEHPILFSGPMVRAILDGRKMITRRAVKRINAFGNVAGFGSSDTPGYSFRFRDKRMRWNELRCDELLAACPYGVPGDRLWVRETWAATEDIDGRPVLEYAAGGTRIISDGPTACHGEHRVTALVTRWRPSIHMPRWASRITLEVTAVRVERLQEITQEDAIAEGLIKLPATGRAVLTEGAQYFGNCWSSPRDGFRELWNGLNGKRGFPWDANPWVWVVKFKRGEG